MIFFLTYVRIPSLNHGLLDPIIGNIFRARGVSPKGQDDLDHLRQIINRAGFRAIEVGLVPIAMAREYFFYQGLEELRFRHTFDVEYERHSRGVVEQIATLAQEMDNASMASIGHWSNGRIGLLVGVQKRLHQASRQNAVLRESENVADLTRITEMILQNDDKGVLLIPFSAANSPLAHSLRRNFWENSPIELRITRGGLERSPEVTIQERLQEGTEISDELYAQHFLGSVMSAAVKSFAASKGRFINYMQNYEALEETISTVATSFSLAEIEELAQSRKDILDVIRTHPSSAPLLSYISRLLI